MWKNENEKYDKNKWMWSVECFMELAASSAWKCCEQQKIALKTFNFSIKIDDYGEIEAIAQDG